MIKTREDELKLNEHLFVKMLQGWADNAHREYLDHVHKATELIWKDQKGSDKEYHEGLEAYGRYDAITKVIDAYNRQVLYKRSEIR